MPSQKFLLAGLASASLLLTACGGGSSSTPSTSNPTATPTPAPTTAPTAEPTPTPTAEPTPTPTPAPIGGATKVQGPLDPLQDEVVDGIVVAQVGSQLPSPLSGVTACTAATLNYLIDVPDAILAGGAGLAEGADPFNAFNGSAAEAQAALERFAGALQGTLLAVSGRSDCDPDEDRVPSSSNPLAGTPLAPVGAAIADLMASIGEANEDPNLSSVSNLIAPALADLGAAFALLPAEVTEAPVLGGVVDTLGQAVTDVAGVLVPFGNYDGDATAAASATLISNLLNGVLLGVLPVGEVDAALIAAGIIEAGDEFSPQIATGIATLTATLGDSLGLVVTPVFNEGLDGVAAPVLDPLEGVLAAILGAGNPLDGALGLLAGDMLNTPADALLGVLLSAVGGAPLGSDSYSPLTLLGVLADQLASGDLDAQLGTASAQNQNGSISLGTILDGILGDGGLFGDDLLGGLLGGLL